MRLQIENELCRVLEELTTHLEDGIIPFWLKNGIDHQFGGYLTCFDENGEAEEDVNKYLVTQTRMIWGFSALSCTYPTNQTYKMVASQGVDFLIKHFYDDLYGGWYWKVSREGTLIDDGKVVYGQSFVIYALAQYYLATGDGRALEFAEKTFDALQIYCTDTLRGGYYENLERDWAVSEDGFCGGDRKSLDIHMHLMEAFTLLYKCSQKAIYKQKLEEVIGIILTKMINTISGCGYNQFDLNFHPIPAIDIRRTWNAERLKGEVVEVPTDTTSYGHNVELSWLLNLAGDVLNKPADFYEDYTLKLLNHSILYGFDHELGGVYRDGPHEGNALVYDKEWWQNAEVLVGYLDGYERYADEKYLDAFLKTWTFDKTYFINSEIGEWRQLLDKKGRVISGAIGNPWKAIYHSGRSVMECKRRLEKLLNHQS